MSFQISDILEIIQDAPNLSDDAKGELMSGLSKMKDSKGTLAAWIINFLKFWFGISAFAIVILVYALVNKGKIDDIECQKEKAAAIESQVSVWRERYIIEREDKKLEKQRGDSLQSANIHLMEDENLRRFELLKMKLRNDENTITITPKNSKQ